MFRKRSRIYSKFILLLDKSLLFHERFIRCKCVGGEITYSIISSKKVIAIDAAYDEMISELLDEFSILCWRKNLLTCLNDEIVVKNNSAVTNVISAPRELYYYRVPGQTHDQDLFSTQFSNTRGMFLTNSLRNIIK